MVRPIRTSRTCHARGRESSGGSEPSAVSQPAEPQHAAELGPDRRTTTCRPIRGTRDRPEQQRRCRGRRAGSARSARTARTQRTAQPAGPASSRPQRPRLARPPQRATGRTPTGRRRRATAPRPAPRYPGSTTAPAPATPATISTSVGDRAHGHHGPDPLTAAAPAGARRRSAPRSRRSATGR